MFTCLHYYSMYMIGIPLVLGVLTPNYTVTPCPGENVSLICTATGGLLIWNLPLIAENFVLDSNSIADLPIVVGQYTVTTVMVADGMISSDLIFPATAMTIDCTPLIGRRDELIVQVASESFCWSLNH